MHVRTGKRSARASHDWVCLCFVPPHPIPFPPLHIYISLRALSFFRSMSMLFSLRCFATRLCPPSACPRPRKDPNGARVACTLSSHPPTTHTHTFLCCNFLALYHRNPVAKVAKGDLPEERTWSGQGTCQGVLMELSERVVSLGCMLPWRPS